MYLLTAFVACRSKLAVSQQFLALMTQSVDSNSRVWAFVREAFAVGGFGKGASGRRACFRVYPTFCNLANFAGLCLDHSC